MEEPSTCPLAPSRSASQRSPFAARVPPCTPLSRRAQPHHPRPPSAPQGYRTAQNAGVPFVVLGRRLSPDALKRNLAPLLAIKRAGRRPSKADGNYHPSDRTFGLREGDAKAPSVKS